MTRIDILYFDHCPHAEQTVDRVRAVALHLGVEIDLRLVQIASSEAAERARFLGSPTVRVNGVDIDPSASDRSDFSLSCRMYPGGGVPSETMIAEALKKP